VRALQDIIDPTRKMVIIFGAGGAARAVAVEMALGGRRAHLCGQLMNIAVLSKIAAEDRQTGYYLGGDAELVEKMRPVLDPISSAILDFGCYGANLCEKDFHIIRTGVSGHEPCEVAKAKRSLLRGLSLRGNEPTTRQ